MTDVLKSKRFITALVAMLVMLIVVAFPEFQSAETELITAIAALALLLVGGQSLEDALRVWLGYPGNIQRVGSVAAYGMDKFEAVTGKDIPDALEAVIRVEIENALKKLTEKPFDQTVNDVWVEKANG